MSYQYAAKLETTGEYDPVAFIILPPHISVLFQVR